MLRYECHATNQITGFGLEHKFVSALQLFGYGCWYIDQFNLRLGYEIFRGESEAYSKAVIMN